MSAMTMNFAYDSKSKEAQFFSQDGTALFTMSELSFTEANTINDAIRVLEKKAYDRGAEEAIRRARTALNSMAEEISLDNEEDDHRPKLRTPTKKRRVR
jgi:hypothetical protein